jgi:hypothetical protein
MALYEIVEGPYNVLKELYKTFKGLMMPIESLIRRFEGLLRPIKGLIRLFESPQHLVQLARMARPSCLDMVSPAQLVSACLPSLDIINS